MRSLAWPAGIHTPEGARAFQEVCTASRFSLAKKPSLMSFEEAATIPWVFILLLPSPPSPLPPKKVGIITAAAASVVVSASKSPYPTQPLPPNPPSC